MKNIAIIRYPGSNCDIETMKYFSFGGNKCFYLWHETHKIDYIDIEKVDLIVIPGGFAFGDRIYDKATNSYEMSPGTMAIKCGVTKIIHEANSRRIPILGICNGFQILTQLGLLSGNLELNDTGKFICKKTKSIINYFNHNVETELYIANSYGKYVPSNNIQDNNLQKNEIPFIKYTL